MSIRRLFSLAGLIVFASATCIADDAAGAAVPKKKEPKHPGVGQIDTNGDGKVSYEEMKAKVPKMTGEKFKARDKNGDGFLTPDERTISDPKAKPAAKPAMQTESGHHPGQIFTQADKDANGQVTLEEIHAVAPKFPEKRFKELDKNGDGAISQDESPRTRAARTAPEKPGMEAVFIRADKDANGKVTFDELKAIAPKITKDKFDKIDKNNDGTLEKSELPKPPVSDKEQSVAMLARKADADKNGKVTYDEMLVVTPNLTRDRFDQMDVNKDGVLSSLDRDQVQKDSKQGVDEGALKIMESDANKDGSVSFEELTAAKPGFPREAFDRVDRNKDGVISDADAKK